MTGFPLTMSGWDRTYQPPRPLRASVPMNTTAWDLMHYTLDPAAGQWATATLDSLVASVEAENADALGCIDCQDTGFYGVADPDDPDMLTGLIRRVGNGSHQALQTCGIWQDWDPLTASLEILTLDLAGDLAAAITGGACGLVRRYLMPRAFLPPAPVVSAAPLSDALTSLISPEPPGNTESSDNDWVTYAIVDELDPGAVLDLVRVRAAGDVVSLERYEDCSWTPDRDLLTQEALPTVRLTDSQLADVQEQFNPSVIVADAPLTVSPDPRAERLRRYWTTGKGGAKVRWTAPGSGDWYRCVRHLSKYMGTRAKGYCANLHKRATGVWPGDHRNTGHRGGRHLLSAASPEESLLASVRSGQWGRDKERNTGMPLEMELLTDGIYYEGDDENAGILRTLTAGGFPVAPPDEWYADPKLPGPTPMVVEDDGRVFGHLATWDVTHIGMAGATHAPRSPSNYAYFLTGSLKTASGKSVNVGQLTLAGGHADINGNAQAAVQHYDDTNSAVADVMVGEDQYGIWAAGGMRPNVTPEQVRVFRASPPSGDWRPINGHLEMVACCSVNVPGFMNVRPTARVAGGAVLALVAAGTRELNAIRQAQLATPAMVARLETLEHRVDDLAVPVTEPPVVQPVSEPVPAPPPSVEPEPVLEPEPSITAAEFARAQHIAQVRDEIQSARRDALRERMQSTTAAGKVPPQFKKKQAADDAEDKADGGKDEASEPKDADDKGKTIPGTDSFPIKDVASLKDAIQAFGRAKDKAAAQKHITKMAFQLKRPDLIPAKWKK